jgi:hypothetical protein
MVAAVIIVMLAQQTPTGRGTPFRCRNKEPKCDGWAKIGECEKNYPFMAETCPVACSYCENAGLLPTPAEFELDFVCKGKLKHYTPSSKDGTLSGKAFDRSDLPPGCLFRCRNNMTDSICEAAEAQGACTDKAKARTLRFQCPQTCGVCAALALGEGKKKYKRRECEDSEAQRSQCAQWAAGGECVNNWPFMHEECGLSCGNCRKPKAKPKPAGGTAAPEASLVSDAEDVGDAPKEEVVAAAHDEL